MPSGIILSSGTAGATQEDIERVLTANGYEPEKPEPKAEAEPKEQPEGKAEAEKAEPEEKEEPQKPSRFQRRVERETRELLEQNQQLQERLAALEGKKEEKAEAQEPKREDYSSDKEFEDARDDYKYKLRRSKEEAEENQKRLTQHLNENLKRYNERKEEIKKEYADWDDLDWNQPLLPIIRSAILSLDDGPRVAHYLATNPEKLEKLNDMHDDAAWNEVVRLHDRLKTGSAAKEGAVTPKPKAKLPEPPKPVTAAPTSSTLTAAEAAQKRDYRAWKAAYKAGR